MINTKITKTSNQQTNEERLFKLLESMDWKLWEMYNMMKDFTSKELEGGKKSSTETKQEPKPKSKLAEKAVTKKDTEK